MLSAPYKPCAALALLCVLGACAGSGKGLDQNGDPSGTGGAGGAGGTGGAVTADFQSIQDNVFTPICSKCHIGASAPEGLQLDAAHSYNLLVGVPSAEEPGLLRINPANPDLSYLVLKIEGAPGIEGGQMPLGETPLPQATIDAIRQWVSNGAPNVPAGMPASFEIQTTAPLDATTVSAPVRQIVVTFTQELDASLVNETTISLERVAAAAAPGASVAEPEAAVAAQLIPMRAALAAKNQAVLLITPTAALGAGVYRAHLRGTGGAALATLDARTLGRDVSFEFTVESVP